MNEITKEELDNFIKIQNHILNLVEEKTKELSLILYNRLPEGEICDANIFESEFKPGCIFIEFEEYRCGESWRDQYNLPMRFLYDKDYPAIYKKEYEEKEKFREKKIKESKHKKEKYEKLCLKNFERDEYNRLRKKYE